MTKTSGIALLLLLLACSSERRPAEKNVDPAQELVRQNDRWRFFLEENRINRLLFDLSQKHKPRAVAFINANVIAMASEAVQNGLTVLVEDGLIKAIGEARSIAVPPHFIRLDCTGKYLMPGLTDNHLHTMHSNSHALLNLANGVTTVRELCGFPWTLRMREQIRQNRLLAPNLYTSGPILNYVPLDFYATVVRTPEEGRQRVLEHKNSGYDFIKVHNNMPRKIYEAVLAEAKKENIPVVGHIPHDVKLEDAIKLGQRTFEHFKGYYYDRTIEMTEEDYVALTEGANVWNCPTFYTYRLGVVGQGAIDLLARGNEFKYVSAFDRKRWQETYPYATPNPSTRVYVLSKKIFRDLLEINAKFLAGTDSGGGYDLMVPGFALLEELAIMDSLGMPIYEVLKTATVNAAEAMNRSHEFGTIAIGKRADLVLLSANPLESIRHLSENEGVMVRGIWLAKTALAESLAKVEGIYAHRGEPLEPATPEKEMIDNLVASHIELHSNGFVMMDHYLSELSELLKARNLMEHAEAIQQLKQEN
jgi:imidazolonepropionase-like amidohydrolase